MAIAGGTFSVIGGGKFSNGAFGGAMTHLFNGEYDNLGKALKGLWSKKGEILSDAGKGFRGLVENTPRAIQNSHPAAKAVLTVAGAQIMLGGIAAGELAIGVVLTKPVETYSAIMVVEGYYGGIPTNTLGSFINGFESRTGINIVPSWLKP